MEKPPVNKGKRKKKKKKAISSKDKSASRVITSQVKWRKFFQQLEEEIRSAVQRTKASPFPPPRATAPRRVMGKECARRGCQAAVPVSWQCTPGRVLPAVCTLPGTRSLPPARRFPRRAAGSSGEGARSSPGAKEAKQTPRPLLEEQRLPPCSLETSSWPLSSEQV